MKPILQTVLVVFSLILEISLPAQDLQLDSVAIRKIYDQALIGGESYSNLQDLSTNIGARLSGSTGAEKAVQWAKNKLYQMNPDTVYLQEVKVPHWIRGSKAQASMCCDRGNIASLTICALGESPGTNGVLRGNVMEVKSVGELQSLTNEEVRDKIIFFNGKLDPAIIESFTGYLQKVDQRLKGPSEASKRGAKAVLLRSLTLSTDDLPHTGNMRFEKGVARIPAAALSTKSADLLSNYLKKNSQTIVSLEMDCKQLPDVVSHNVIGEIRGSTFPNEVITIGAHLDSWDLGQGASDNGAGLVQCLEAIRILKKTGFQPFRTVRIVLYMDEEIQTSGAKQYAIFAANNKKENYLAAIETDAGGFMPKGFRLDGSAQAVEKIKSWSSLFTPYHSDAFVTGHRGVDIGLVDTLAQVRISLDCFDQRFMSIHHTIADTFDKINQRELELGGASLASLVYLIARYGLENKPSKKVVYSPSRTANGFTFLSGQIGISPATQELVRSSFSGQTEQVFKNIEQLLKKEGLGMGDIIDVTIYLTDISNYDQVNGVYAKYFARPYPTRVCIAVKDLPADADIEVAVTAAAQKPRRLSLRKNSASNIK